MTDFARLLHALVEARVEFIIVGGLAATIHGAARLTRDIDVVYARSAENLRRLVEAAIPSALECRCLDLPALIRAKRAAGRPKDHEAIAELEAWLEERDRGG